MSYAYASANLCSGLAAGAFVFSAGLNDATRTRLNDTRMSSRYVNGAAVASGLSFTIDLGSAIPTSALALLNTNCAVQKNDATVRIRGGTAAAGGLVTAGIVTAKAASTLNPAAPYNKDHVFQYTPITKQFLEVLFTWTGTVTNFAIGEVWAMVQTTLARKSIYGGGEDEEIASASVGFDNGGTRSTFKGGPLRSQRLPFSDLNLTERREQATMWRATRGDVQPFIWIDSVEATATAAAITEQAVIFGKLQVPKYAWSEPDYALFDPSELLIRSLSREVGS